MTLLLLIHVKLKLHPDLHPVMGKENSLAKKPDDIRARGSSSRRMDDLRFEKCIIYLLQDISVNDRAVSSVCFIRCINV